MAAVSFLAANTSTTAAAARMAEPDPSRTAYLSRRRSTLLPATADAFLAVLPAAAARGMTIAFTCSDTKVYLKIKKMTDTSQTQAGFKAKIPLCL